MSPTRVSRLSRLEAAVRTVLAFTEVLNSHDVSAMLQLLSIDCVLEAAVPAPDGMHLEGRESLLAYWQGFLKDYPDYRLQVEEIFGLGNRCILRWRSQWSGADSGQSHARGVDIYNVREKLICEILSYAKG